MPSWLDELNPAQRSAVMHGDGPMLVIAGAGTGKTRTLASRVAWLIQQGVPPGRILLLTFTRRAASEMVRRAAEMVALSGRHEGTEARRHEGERRRPAGEGEHRRPAGAEAEGAGIGDRGSGPAFADRSEREAQASAATEQPHDRTRSPAPRADQIVARVWGGTFHAVANRLLRQYGRAIGLPPDFTVMDESDAADLMNLIRNELGAAKKDRRFPRKQTLAAIYSRVVNAQQKLRDVLEKSYPWCREDREGIAAIFEAYQQRKLQRGLLDYDDLLLYWKAIAEAPGIGKRIAGLFDHILVDEYQDTNAVQAGILRAMRRENRNIMVVGDDAQSIYSFRAATVRNILDFPEQFEGCRTIALEQNYRSTQPILEASNAVMEYATERYTKNLWSNRRSELRPLLVSCRDEEQQTHAVCENVLGHLEQGTALRQQAVLFRAGHHSAHLEIELTRRNIPFHKYGGLKFVEAAHVKDVLALLRIVENPYDEISWFRVLHLIEGVGPRTARRVMEELGVFSRERQPAQGKDELSEVEWAEEEASAVRAGDSPLSRLGQAPPSVPPPARGLFGKLREMLLWCCGNSRLEAGSTQNRLEADTTGRGTTRLETGSTDHRLETGDTDHRLKTGATDHRLAEPSLAEQVERIRDFYDPICRRVYDNGAIRLRDIEQLAHIAGGYRSRSRFITDLTLDPPAATSDLAQPPFLEEDYLILSTMHSAKGCEWTAVHVLHAADGMIPSDMATGDAESIDEERRLFYVALTRAKDYLYVYFPLRYYHSRFGHADRHNYGQLTRFIPRSVRALFDERTPALEEQDEPIEPIEPATVQARLSDLWRE